MGSTNQPKTLAELGELISTEDLSALIAIAQPTLRAWAQTGSGPLRPIRFSSRGPLRWRKSDIVRLIAGSDQG